ncbi:MAG: hypothetical protein ACRDHO_06995 [Actinomycetota bacterium]
MHARSRANGRARRHAGGQLHNPAGGNHGAEAAQEAIGGEEFVFDIQGHLLEYDLNPILNGQDFWQRFPQQGCGEEDPRACYSIESFLELMFLRSDTSMVVLSALPIYPEGSPLSTKAMDETRRIAEGLCRDDRVLLHAQALPNVHPSESALGAMDDLVRRYPIVAWKTFTHFPDVFEHNGRAWWLDDHDPTLPQVGERFIDRAVRLGVPTICAHKGFSGGSPYASPRDVGPAARAHPEANFVVYHSGFEARLPEGPYTASTAHVGVNRLSTSMQSWPPRRSAFWTKTPN